MSTGANHQGMMMMTNKLHMPRLLCVLLLPLLGACSTLQQANWEAASGNTAQAILLYEQAIAQEPEAFWPRMRLVELLVRQKDYRRGLDEADTLIDLHPREWRPRFFRGVALTGLGQRDEAMRLLTRIDLDYTENYRFEQDLRNGSRNTFRRYEDPEVTAGRLLYMLHLAERRDRRREACDQDLDCGELSINNNMLFL